MLVFGSVLLTDSTEICLFHITSLGWSQIPAKINEGDVCLLLPSIFIARESQRLQWSHLAKSLGQAANFEAQLMTTTQQKTNTTSLSALQVLVRGSLVLGEAISLQCNLVIVLVLGSCGTLALSCAPYIFYLLLLLLTTSFLFS